MKFHIDKTGESQLCGMWRVENETVSHIVSECKMLAQKEYKKEAGQCMQLYSVETMRKTWLSRSTTEVRAGARWGY